MGRDQDRRNYGRRPCFPPVWTVPTADYLAVQFGSAFLKAAPENAKGSWFCSIAPFYSSLRSHCVTIADLNLSEASVKTHISFLGLDMIAPQHFSVYPVDSGMHGFV